VIFAYADPPYVGQAKRHYNSEEVDHVALIQMLVSDFPDGWALSAMLNVQPGDEVVDLYPGTGVMGRVAHEVTGR
jgi:site-specific DNA-adenine methylase